MKDGAPLQSIMWTRRPGNYGIASDAVAGVRRRKLLHGRELPALVLIEAGLLILTVFWWL
ncbi:hypothetical protein ATN84_03245 [Paramesorhizobium deserti]|uniref:Uncharacterized protein n=1 Tax=Paramesorhizobium deserti TaxID=1494590 RepID=A0A135I026_9HYPH|nr:hypothetical protein [Paramesorhizobium deserti]KXF78797.1 hypothetical protein ATN84_03245 [Paramesorhizobium deserti]